MHRDLLNIDNDDVISDETVSSSLKIFRDIAESVISERLKGVNVELYKDMIITKVTPIKKDTNSTEIEYYIYDVKDPDTNDTYENLESKSGITSPYTIGDLVRVYVSNIVYIGFKL